jgi:hypothetical protein
MMNENYAIFAKLERLIDEWCERRCLKPLFYILRDYPLCSELVHSWGLLLESLLEIKQFCNHELTLQERELLLEIIDSAKRKIQE